MIPTKTIVDKANADISTGGLTDLEYTQLTSTDVFLDLVGPKVVASSSLLPSAANNEGIMYYVTNESIYYFSDGTMWRKDFTSDVTVPTTVAYAWGGNSYGQLGTGGTTSTSSPVTVVGGIITWSQLSAGPSHSLGSTSAGIAYAWGSNFYGKLGNGGTTSVSSPVTVVGGITTWSQLSAGTNHSLGVTSTGIAYAWGRSNYGQLGQGGTTDRSSPVTVVGGITTWSQLSAGNYHCLGRTSAGIAYAWGKANYGQLGNGGTTNRSSPVTVVGGITTWSQLSAGNYHSLGLTSAGIAYAWGYNITGQLGDNSLDARSSPVTVVGGITTWSQLSSGKSDSVRAHTLGLTSASILYAWGYNNVGQLGDGTITTTSSPVTVVGGITIWNSIAAGRSTSLARTSTGIAYAWGNNNVGQLGTGGTGDRSSPVTVAGGITNWSQLAAGGSHSLGLFVREEATKGFA
jgi:alpha-tubulin suppressor-like RCC1 family protein